MTTKTKPNNYRVYFKFTDDKVLHTKAFKEDWSEVKKYLDGLLLFKNLNWITVTRSNVSDKAYRWNNKRRSFQIESRNNKPTAVSH